MANNIFRKSALDRVASVDGLDKNIQIVSTKGWIALIFMIILIVVTLIWSILSEISTFVEASGIVMYGSGIETVTATKDGIITDLNIDVGDTIVKNTTIARIDVQDTIDEISTYKDYCSQLDDFKDSNFQNIDVLSYELYSILSDDISTYNTATDSDIKKTMQTQLNNDYNILKNDYTAKIEDLQAEVLSESCMQNASEGKVLEVYKSTGDYVNIGDTIASIIIQSIDGSDQENSLNSEVIVYMPVADGKKISKGMEVQVSPSTVDKEKYGCIVGLVKSVSEYAVSEESMMSVLNNEQLVESLSTGEALIEIHVELLKDSSTVSGYKWTTKNGAPVTIAAGTVCSARVEIDTTRPIEVVFPFIKTMLDGTN